MQTLGGSLAPSFSATCVAENGGASRPAREAPINRRFPNATDDGLQPPLSIDAQMLRHTGSQDRIQGLPVTP
jgi:hypothetical protein